MGSEHLNAMRKLRSAISPRALQEWRPMALSRPPGDTVSILGPIGKDPFTGEGVSASEVLSAIESMSGPITVAVNSPGGSYFDGLAIYNALRAYDGDVTVRIYGAAASAASVIAMAGDRIEIAKAGFLMIHKASAMVIGNADDMRGVGDVLDQFDEVMIGVYVDRTGLPTAKVAEMVADETWIRGAEAVDLGFADAMLSADAVPATESADSRAIAAERIDLLLSQAGLSRNERRGLMNELKAGTRSAARQAEEDMPSAIQAAGGEEKLAEVHSAIMRLALGMSIA